MKLRHDLAALQQFCRAHGVARLELSGSALRDDFRPDSEDARLIERAQKAHGSRPRIPWSQVKTELGLDGNG